MAPTRTCIGCRKRAPASDLARLALSSDGRVVVWRRGADRPAGRGASLHAGADCLRAALKAGALSRAFRTAVGRLDETEFLQQLNQVVVNRKNP
jgi:predicted RNA-binding protein YlxR (DUF448 family)